MNKKLTLNTDAELIEFAHADSKKTRQSISCIFEKYLMNLKNSDSDETFVKEINELYGSFEQRPIPDKKELRKAFHEKNIN
jgi:hypothetical protein